jgi:hypothetical protein
MWPKQQAGAASAGLFPELEFPGRHDRLKTSIPPALHTAN